MRGLADRLTKVLVPALVGLAVSASSSSAARPVHAPISGVVPHAGSAQLFGALSTFAPTASSSGPLVLQTQPCNLANECWVMRTNTIYAIYWMPAGSTCDLISCAAYQSGVNQYFTDVAAAGGRADNVYSAATQYYDATGPISYRSTFAGSFVDTDPFPTSGCDDSFHGVTDPVCLTDGQIETEIQHVLTTNGWHGSTTTMFFLLTPDHVGSCFLPGTATGDPNQACTTTVYCAYHSGFPDSNNEPVIYGNEPFNATIGGCHNAPGQGSPNDPDIDPSLNTISHEQNEAITDPWGNAWYSNDGNGDENGDLCAWNFGPTQTTAGGQAYNQVINGHDYSLQQEYSNDGLTCVQHYLGIPVDFGAPTVSGTAAQGQVLSVAQGLWSQSPTSYVYAWQRCAPNGTSCTNIPGATSNTYLLGAADGGHTVRVDVSAQNGAGTSAPVPSAVTSVVIPLPGSTAAPVVSGVAAVGKQLSTTSGVWNTPANFAYAWLRCASSGTGCAVIPGATATTYVPTTADAGHTLEAVVSATNVAGTASATSPATAVVVSVPHASRAPRISGKAKVGKRLTAGAGTWTGPPQTYRYAWLRCSPSGGKCRPIKKATHAAYRLTRQDAGHRLRVRIIATNAAGIATATSNATKRVPAVQRRG